MSGTENTPCYSNTIFRVIGLTAVSLYVLSPLSPYGISGYFYFSIVMFVYIASFMTLALEKKTLAQTLLVITPFIAFLWVTPFVHPPFTLLSRALFLSVTLIYLFISCRMFFRETADMVKFWGLIMSVLLIIKLFPLFIYKLKMTFFWLSLPHTALG